MQHKVHNHITNNPIDTFLFFFIDLRTFQVKIKKKEENKKERAHIIMLLKILVQ